MFLIHDFRKITKNWDSKSNESFKIFLESIKKDANLQLLKNRFKNYNFLARETPPPSEFKLTEV